MFGRSWRIGRVGGIPVNIDSSWVWIAVLIVYTLWTRFDTDYLRLSPMASLAFAIGAAALFFGSVFLHEVAHAVAARLNGIEVHGITLVLFGGFTSARTDEKGPGASFVVSAAGPATSLALAASFWALMHATAGSSDVVSGTFRYLGVVNAFMAVFNSIPGLPLDGGRMLLAAVWRISGDHRLATKIAAWSGMAVGALTLAGAVVLLSRGDHLFGQAIWFAIIGFFIFQGARAAAGQFAVHDRLAQGTVADAMGPPPPAVPADLSLSETLDRFLRGHEGEAFPVVEDGRVIGMVSFSSAAGIGAQDPLRPVRDAVIPLEDVLVAQPEEQLDAVAQRLGTERAALVLDEGRLVGAISGRGLMRWAESHPAR